METGEKLTCVLHREQLLRIGYSLRIRRLTAEPVTGIFPTCSRPTLTFFPRMTFYFRLGREVGWLFISTQRLLFPFRFVWLLTNWTPTFINPQDSCLLSDFRQETRVLSITDNIFTTALNCRGFREGRIACLQAGAPETDGERANRMENGFWGLGDHPGGSVVRISPSNAGSGGSIPGGGAKTPRALNQNRKQKRRCTKLKKDLKNSPH